MKTIEFKKELPSVIKMISSGNYTARYKINVPSNLGVRWRILASHNHSIIYKSWTHTNLISISSELPLAFDSYDLFIEFYYNGARSIKVKTIYNIPSFMTRPKDKPFEKENIKSNGFVWPLSFTATSSTRTDEQNDAIKASQQTQDKHYYIHYIAGVDPWIKNPDVCSPKDDFCDRNGCSEQKCNLDSTLEQPKCEADVWDGLLYKSVDRIRNKYQDEVKQLTSALTKAHEQVQDLEDKVKSLTGTHNKHVDKIQFLTSMVDRLSDHVRRLEIDKMQLGDSNASLKQELNRAENIACQYKGLFEI